MVGLFQGSLKLWRILLSSTRTPNMGSGRFKWCANALRRSPREEAAMKLLYPRCCVLDVQQQLVVACLRLQDVDGLAHKEVRTFGIRASDVVVLSDWLAGQGVTHVAIEQSAGSWKPLYH